MGLSFDVLFLVSYLGFEIYRSGGSMARRFNLRYATRVAALIPSNPVKWVPIWKHHMTQYLKG
jgi:hypothetical protein